jgi:hypothetical protein
MRHETAIINTQQTNRLTLQLLGGELRELSSTGGDVLGAAPDSVTFRAVRKVGFICYEDSLTNSMTVFRLGDQPFESSDSLLIFRDGNAVTSIDDSWVVRPAGVVGTPSLLCTRNWPGTTKQGMTGLLAGGLSGIVTGAPVRSFQRVTYAFRQIAGQWSLARRGNLAGDTMVALIGPLAPSGDSGLVMHYYDTLNVLIAPANLATKRGAIGRIEIKVKSRNPGAAGARFYFDSLMTQINLRGD